MTTPTKLTSLEQLKSINFKAPPQLTTKVEGKARKAKQNYEYKRMPATYVKKMAEKLGRKETARIVGCSQATLNAGCVSGEIYQPIELAAKGYWQEHYEPKQVERTPLASTERLVVLRLSTNDLKVMEEWLASNNVSFAVLT